MKILRPEDLKRLGAFLVVTHNFLIFVRVSGTSGRPSPTNVAYIPFGVGGDSKPPREMSINPRGCHA